MKQKLKDILEDIKPEIFEAPGVDLVENHILDSLDIMRIVAKLEEEFAIDFDLDDLIPENFSSPEAIWNLLQKYLTQKA